MAALQINHNLQRINNSYSKEDLRFKKAAALISLRPTNCQKSDQGGDRRQKKSKPESPELNGFVGGVVKLGRDLKERMSPKQKGCALLKNEYGGHRNPVSQPLKARLDPQMADHSLQLVNRRELLGQFLGLSGFFLCSLNAEAAGLPPEEKPRLCDDECEKELENVPMVTTKSGLQYKDIIVGRGPSPPVGFQVAANYVAMVPSGQIFDSSLEKGNLYIFRVGSGQVIKGLDEGMLSMKVGGKRRLYIPGPLAFPKGLNSAPGRPRVAPSNPVVFDVSLEYIPGLEVDEE